MASKNKKVKESIKSKNTNKIVNRLEDSKISDVPVDESINESIFNSRRLLNNWSKYDVDTDDSYSFGKDFTTVLESSEKVNFKYQYQNIFDDLLPIEKNQELDNNFLALDLNYLSSLLDCIPLHQRYDLSEDIFEVKEIENFIVDATTAETKFKAKYFEEKSNIQNKSVKINNINKDYTIYKDSENSRAESKNNKTIANIQIDSSKNSKMDIKIMPINIINKMEIQGHELTNLSNDRTDVLTDISNTAIKISTDEITSIGDNVIKFNESDTILPEMNLDLKTNLSNVNISSESKNNKANIDALEAELEFFLNI